MTRERVLSAFAARDTSSRNAPYAIRRGDRPGLLLIALSGRWSDADFDRYDAALRAALGRFPPGQPHDLLVDLSGFDIQPDGMAARFRAQMADGRLFARRTALVVPVVIRRVQVMPLMDVRPLVRMFDNQAQAMRWLEDDSATRFSELD